MVYLLASAVPVTRPERAFFILFLRQPFGRAISGILCCEGWSPLMDPKN